MFMSALADCKGESFGTARVPADLRPPTGCCGGGTKALGDNLGSYGETFEVVGRASKLWARQLKL